MQSLSTTPAGPLAKAPTASSPLILCDRLITLAQDADRAGFPATAEHLVHLAHSVFEEPAQLA